MSSHPKLLIQTRGALTRCAKAAAAGGMSPKMSTGCSCAANQLASASIKAGNLCSSRSKAVSVAARFTPRASAWTMPTSH